MKTSTSKLHHVVWCGDREVPRAFQRALYTAILLELKERGIVENTLCTAAVDRMQHL